MKTGAFDYSKKCKGSVRNRKDAYTAQDRKPTEWFKAQLQNSIAPYDPNEDGDDGNHKQNMN